MNRAYTTGIAAAALGVAHLAHAEDAQSILETAQAKQVERWTGVDRYIVTQRVMGQSTDTTYQRTEVQMSDGSTQTLFLPVAGGQAGAQDCGPMQMTPEALEAYAAGSEMVGAGMASEIEDGLEAAGLPRGLLAASGSEPNATFDPRVMMGGNAAFVRAAADAQRQQATDAARAPEQAAESADHMAEFMRRANLVGTETVDGRDSFHLRAEGLGMVQESDGREYTIESMSMWLDASEYVPLRTRVDGTMVAGDETSPMTIETVQSDYREVPGSSMYEAYRSELKISGMFDAAQEAEMQEAQAKMMEFEKQLAEMPPDQRRMMEGMMGSQLETMRAMAAGGGFQSEMTVTSITVNPPAVNTDGTPCPSGSVGQSPPAPAAAAAVGAAASAAPVASDPAALRTAQEACLQQKVDEAQATQKTKRGIGSLISGVSRAASRFGGGDIAGDISRTAGDIYAADATAKDFAQAAKDLGLSESDIEACQSPQ